ncbi:hypothetical protein [Streptomyces sp. NPDC050564]|uniref:hypothetical protein n=1 Tax=Streptomyces sp. NPDC050564 TaxID=3365631 RepID=UPI0037A8D7E8
MPLDGYGGSLGNAVLREDSALEQGMGSGCLAECEVLQRQLEPPLGIGPHGEPEVGRVVGVSLRVTQHEFVVAGCRALAPLVRLLEPVACVQRGREVAGVLGVVAGPGEGTQEGDGGLRVFAQQLDLGQVAQCRRVVGHPAPGGLVARAGRIEIALAVPHHTASEIQLGERKRRRPLIVAPRLAEQPLRLGDLPAFGLEYGERAERREVALPLRRFADQGHGIRVAAEGLQDDGSFRVHCGLVPAVPARRAEVGNGLGEAVQGRPRPGAGEQGRAVLGCAVHQPLSEVRGLLVVGDAAQDVASEVEEVDQGRPLRHRQRSPRRPPGTRTAEPYGQAVDLPVQIRYGDGAVRRDRLPLLGRRPGHAASSRGGICAARRAPRSGGAGLGAFRWGKVSVAS